MALRGERPPKIELVLIEYGSPGRRRRQRFMIATAAAFLVMLIAVLIAFVLART